MRLITYTFHLMDPDRTMVASLALSETMPHAKRIALALGLVGDIRFYGVVDPRDGRHIVPAIFEVHEDGRVIALT